MSKPLQSILLMDKSIILYYIVLLYYITLYFILYIYCIILYTYIMIWLAMLFFSATFWPEESKFCGIYLVDSSEMTWSCSLCCDYSAGEWFLVLSYIAYYRTSLYHGWLWIDWIDIGFEQVYSYHLISVIHIPARFSGCGSNVVGHLWTETCWLRC